MSIKINNNVVIGNDRSFITASGTTAERPANPEVGMIRYNTTTLLWELYNGVEWENITEPPPLITAWTWGSGSSGQLGTNDINNRSSPVSVVGGFTDWEQISVGSTHSLARRSDGTLWVWGSNSFGQLGINLGTTLSRSSPVSVVGGITDWTQIAAGNYHNLALRSNGTLWAWGNNGSGRLGDTTTTARSSPISVVGGITNWTQISAGGAHNLALRSNGTLWAWGSNATYGQLGTNSTVAQTSPVQAAAASAITDWIKVSAGSIHSVAQRSNGSLWAWGSGDSGRLGNNSTLNRSSPVSVVGGFTDWVQISGGTFHTAALRSNGTLWAWGANNNGNLGTNNVINSSSPVSVVGGFTDWTQITANIHNVALRSNGTLWVWGFGTNGRLGNDGIINSSSPVSVVGGFTDWVQISAGGGHNLALRST
jgi:alpha-tubulin suppressor-like RCC1 family protein